MISLQHGILVYRSFSLLFVRMVHCFGVHTNCLYPVFYVRCSGEMADLPGLLQAVYSISALERVPPVHRSSVQRAAPD